MEWLSQWFTLTDRDWCGIWNDSFFDRHSMDNDKVFVFLSIRFFFHCKLERQTIERHCVEYRQCYDFCFNNNYVPQKKVFSWEWFQRKQLKKCVQYVWIVRGFRLLRIFSINSMLNVTKSIKLDRSLGFCGNQPMDCLLIF